MRGCTRKKLDRPSVAHKSTGGVLHSIPEPVDPVGNAPPPPSTQLLNPDVFMMEPVEDWYRCDAAELLRPPARSFFATPGGDW
jgi:hypothetical protein